SAVGLKKLRKSQPIGNIAEWQITEQWEEECQEEEEIKDDNENGIGYSTADLYESDDLSHLDRLVGQLDDDQVANENSDDDREGAVAKGVDDRENPQCSRNKRKTMKSRLFNVKAKASFQRRYKSIGRKWELSSSGKFVEDLLFYIGMNCEYYQ
ncbi:hypothetical protein BGZ52_003808, partial [Haplosporangium bisporale]